MSCHKAPPGWYCKLERGHDGPCAAEPGLVERVVHWWYMRPLRRQESREFRRRINGGSRL